MDRVTDGKFNAHLKCELTFRCMSSRFLPNQLVWGLDKVWFLMAVLWLGQGAFRKGHRGPGLGMAASACSYIVPSSDHLETVHCMAGGAGPFHPAGMSIFLSTWGVSFC